MTPGQADGIIRSDTMSFKYRGNGRMQFEFKSSRENVVITSSCADVVIETVSVCSQLPLREDANDFLRCF